MRKERKERHELFRAPETGSVTSLSPNLLDSALSLLWLALDARQGRVSKTSYNHYSPDGVGSMLLLVAGLEAWLNEATLLLPAGDPPLRKLADKPIREKYYEIPERVGHGTIPLNEELKRVLEIRDEVAHFLPYVRGDPNRVPPWLSDLQQRGLFITSGSEVDFDFAVKLCSYRATYWAWDVVHKAVIDFLDAIGPAGQHLRPSAANFERYRSVCSPDKLPAYDAEHNLQ